VKLDDVEVGSRSLELRYTDGYVEQHTASAVVGIAANVTFTYRTDFVQLPKASIKIDGSFDDWNGIPPAFMSGIGLPETKNLAIDKIYLAIDEKNLFIRFDIKDATPSSFFHPNNFNTSHNSVYAIQLVHGAYTIDAQVYFNAHPDSNRWFALLRRKLAGGDWDQTDRTSGNYAMKGQSLEISFPLEQIKKNLGVPAIAGHLMVHAYTGYTDPNWKWVQRVGDWTKTKQFAF
jgi:hypothetical protein